MITMIKKITQIIVLLCNTLAVFAQNGLKGRVVEADGSPVMYAAVILEDTRH